MYTYVLFTMNGAFPKVLAAFADPREAHAWAQAQARANTQYTYVLYFVGAESTLRLGADTSITDAQFSRVVDDMLDKMAR